MKTLVVCLLVVAPASILMAQTPVTLQGVVADPSGAYIPGASVSLLSGGTIARSAESDANGKYTITAIKPGKYEWPCAELCGPGHSGRNAGNPQPFHRGTAYLQEEWCLGIQALSASRCELQCNRSFAHLVGEQCVFITFGND